MLNDATLADAKMLGLDRIVDCLTTNCDGAEIGLCPEEAPPALSDAISRCTLSSQKVWQISNPFSNETTFLRSHT